MSFLKLFAIEGLRTLGMLAVLLPVMVILCLGSHWLTGSAWAGMGVFLVGFTAVEAYMKWREHGRS